MLADLGAQVGLDNDITIFITYLEKPDVEIGMVELSARLRSTGAGMHECRFKDTAPFYESGPISAPIGCRAQNSWGN